MRLYLFSTENELISFYKSDLYNKNRDKTYLFFENEEAKKFKYY